MILQSFGQTWPSLYTPRPRHLHECTASFKSTFANQDASETPTTIVIAHISYAGQGIRCNSQGQAIPSTSNKKNQSAQDREDPVIRVKDNRQAGDKPYRPLR